VENQTAEKEINMTYEVIAVMDHYHGYVNGKFICSGDTQTEVAKDVEEYLRERRCDEDV
jgi:hypothetical protein